MEWREHMQIFQRLYEGLMVILVIVTIVTLWNDNPYYSTINWAVWFIFFIDFFVRLLRSDKKWEFLRKNPLLVIAIIPFDQFFQIARIVRVIYLFRIKTITKYYIQPFVEKLSYQSKAIIFLILFGVLTVESVLIYFVEDNANSLWQSFYYVFGHLMFFGHELFIVENTVTIWFLSVTSIIGIALHGLAIQWLFSKLEVLFKSKSSRTDASSK
jgi:voltage-gated potassium channel